MNATAPYAGWLSLGLALLSWVGVALFALSIQGATQSAVSNIASAHTAESRQAISLRTHVLAQGSAEGRAALQKLIPVDVVSLAALITSVGKDSGSDLKVMDVASENSPNTSSALASFVFTIHASGSFPALIKAEALLEALPAPSVVEQFDIERVPSGASGLGSAWQLNAKVRAFASPATSS